MKCKSCFNHNSPKWILMLILGMILTQTILFAQKTDRVKQELFQPIEAALQQVRDQAVPTFAPNLFAKANRYYRQAEKDYQKGERLNKIRERLEQATKSLNKAVEAASASKVALAGIRETRKQVARFEFIRTLAPKKFAQAERDFRKAILKAEKGDINGARKKAKSVQMSYREATLLALKKGPISRTRDELKRGGADLPDRLKTRARQHIDEANFVLTDVREKPFQIVAVTDAVFSKLSVASAIIHGSTDISRQPPCPDPVQPEIFEFEISAPPPGDLLAHSPIYYLAGGAVDVSLLIPNCTGVSDVSLVLNQGPGGTIELGTDATQYDPIEGTRNNPYYYTVELDMVQPNERHRMTLRLHFPDFDDGRSIGVRITVASLVSAPGFSQVLPFTVALVKEVNGQPRFGLSENDLRNSFIANVYNEFGDTGRSEGNKENEEEAEDEEDAEDGLTLYDPSYSGLKLEIEEDGIHFGWRVKADIKKFCDPTVKMSGRFNLVPSGDQIEVVWADDGPDVEFDYGLFRIDCSIAADAILPIMLLKAFAKSEARQTVRRRIRNQVAPVFAFLDPQLESFIETIETRRDEIQVVFRGPTEIDVPGFSMEDVTLEIPYGRLRLDEPIDLGLAMNPGDQVVLMAAGLAPVCGIETTPPHLCETQTGPAGLFNWDTNHPIPRPWVLTDLGTFAYLEERHKAWKELVGLRRSADRLPFPEENVGLLVGRFENEGSRSGFKLLRQACTVTARSGSEDRLGIGANDYRANNVRELGQGIWQVTVIWSSMALSGSCQESDVFFNAIILDPQNFGQ